AGGTFTSTSITSAPSNEYQEQIMETFLPINFQLFIGRDGSFVDNDNDGVPANVDPDDNDPNVPRENFWVGPWIAPLLFGSLSFTDQQQHRSQDQKARKDPYPTLGPVELNGGGIPHQDQPRPILWVKRPSPGLIQIVQFGQSDRSVLGFPLGEVLVKEGQNFRARLFIDLPQTGQD